MANETFGDEFLVSEETPTCGGFTLFGVSWRIGQISPRVLRYTVGGGLAGGLLDGC